MLNLNILFILPFCYFSSFYYILAIGLYRANMPLDEECMVHVVCMLVSGSGRVRQAPRAKTRQNS
jgi:hypothetical protein